MICQFVPKDSWLIWLWAGWEIAELDPYHGQFSVLASKGTPTTRIPIEGEVS